MRQKVTPAIVIIFVMLFIASSSCTFHRSNEELIISYQQQMDSLASRKIDAASKAIAAQCDSALKYKLPLLVDSILRAKTKTAHYERRC